MVSDFALTIRYAISWNRSFSETYSDSAHVHPNTNLADVSRTVPRAREQDNLANHRSNQERQSFTYMAGEQANREEEKDEELEFADHKAEQSHQGL